MWACSYTCPTPTFAGKTWPAPDPSAWSVRGANLCAWELGVSPPPRVREILIDPAIGRLVIGVATQDEATALRDHLLVTYTYGAAVRPAPTPSLGRARPTASRACRCILAGWRRPSATPARREGR